MHAEVLNYFEKITFVLELKGAAKASSRDLVNVARWL